MKKHMPGFVPIKFNKAGVIILVIGVVLLALKFITDTTGWIDISDFFVYLGVGFLFLSFYLIVIEPEE